MTVDDVQRYLNRSRASVYRYANTDVSILNPDYKSSRLNPEIRTQKDTPLLFHPNEVARFAREVLGLKQVKIEVQESPETATHALLKAILAELKGMRQFLQSQESQG
ncbi:MAG: resolvase [Leptolyngbyaceae cyanobacterium SM1_1_3]|nr:resolvase [Leptolyngbyaceae cyanobacterium SM1_1_3]NJN01557.1 resolvase [Leptolyngbyaceae cyanobacterium RM1_1_2]NJO09835.1 resolvase [Leptolyngbyaceae cyanobacterium SL_1_1]